MKLIVGLGNPGKDYVWTRHNIGFWLIDNFVNDDNWTEKFEGLLYKKLINGEKVFFFKPLTYMNNSGIAISKLVKYYDIDLEDILIIHDDLDLPLGSYKIKYDSSSGGHNGIKSIISYFGSQEFWRLKVGISNDKSNVKDYVLGKFKKSEKDIIEEMLETYNKIINSFIENGGEKTMSLYNKKR